MKKRIVYVGDSNMVYGPDNTYIGTVPSGTTLEKVINTKPSDSIKDIIKLKNAGFTADEIVKLIRGS